LSDVADVGSNYSEVDKVINIGRSHKSDNIAQMKDTPKLTNKDAQLIINQYKVVREKA